MNDIVAFKNAGLPVGSIAKFQTALATAQSNVNVKSGGDFLKLSKHEGAWVYGASETEVQEGSHWAINPASLQMGFISWGKGEVLGKKLLPILTGQTVDRTTLPNTGAPWDECISFQLRCMNGEDEGVQVDYEQNSYGARKAFSQLLQDLQVQIGRDTVNIVPVVVMKSDSYTHKQYGEIFNPVFEVVKWISLSGEVAGQETEDDGNEAAAEPNGAPPSGSQAATPNTAPAKKKRSAVGGAAAAPAAAAPAAPATPAPVVRQRRRPVAG